MKKLYEILVPVTRNGKKIKKKKHRKWDRKVSEIAGGLTLFKAKKGRWLHQGTMCCEKMIRVKIAAEPFQMRRIVSITKEFYKQKAVMNCIITEKVFIE